MSRTTWPRWWPLCWRPTTAASWRRRCRAATTATRSAPLPGCWGLLAAAAAAGGGAAVGLLGRACWWTGPPGQQLLQGLQHLPVQHVPPPPHCPALTHPLPAGPPRAQVCQRRGQGAEAQGQAAVHAHAHRLHGAHAGAAAARAAGRRARALLAPELLRAAGALRAALLAALLRLDLPCRAPTVPAPLTPPLLTPLLTPLPTLLRHAADTTTYRCWHCCRGRTWATWWRCCCSTAARLRRARALWACRSGWSSCARRPRACEGAARLASN